jgi:hypothetical protein
MNEIEINDIELIIIGIIIILQTVVSIYVFMLATKLKKTFPALGSLSIQAHTVSVQDLQFTPTDTVLKKLRPKHTSDQEPIDEDDSDEADMRSVNLIFSSVKGSHLFNTISTSLNGYLLRNQGASADFTLVRDIVERNVDSEYESVASMVSIPLYLGLMGTIFGIVIGLLNLDLSSSSELDGTINEFLQSVEIAMFASLWGLFCSVINSNLSLKSVKRKLEFSKNSFYTFIQTELLPALNQSVSSSVHDLNRNLAEFTNSFSRQIVELKDIVTKNFETVKYHQELFKVIDEMNVVELSKANIDMFKHLKTSVRQLEKFNEYLSGIGKLVEDTTKMSGSFEAILNKTNNFSGLAKKMDQRAEESNNLLKFLQDHFSHLEERGVLITDSLEKLEDVVVRGVKKVDDVMVNSLNELEKHVTARQEAIKKITLSEEDIMIKAFRGNESQLAKLSHLEPIAEDLNNLRKEVNMNSEDARSKIEGLESAMIRKLSLLDKINNNSIFRKIQNFFAFIAKIFFKSQSR